MDTPIILVLGCWMEEKFVRWDCTSLKMITFYSEIFFNESFYYYFFFYSLWVFPTPVITRSLHWSPNECKFPQLSRTILNILANFSSAVVWMVSVLPHIFSSFSIFSKFFEIVQRTPTVKCIDINFSAPWQGPIIYSGFHFSFILTLSSTGMSKSTSWEFFFFYLNKTRSFSSNLDCWIFISNFTVFFYDSFKQGNTK